MYKYPVPDPVLYQKLLLAYEHCLKNKRHVKKSQFHLNQESWIHVHGLAQGIWKERYKRLISKIFVVSGAKPFQRQRWKRSQLALPRKRASLSRSKCQPPLERPIQLESAHSELGSQAPATGVECWSRRVSAAINGHLVPQCTQDGSAAQRPKCVLGQSSSTIRPILECQNLTKYRIEMCSGSLIANGLICTTTPSGISNMPDSFGLKAFHAS